MQTRVLVCYSPFSSWRPLGPASVPAAPEPETPWFAAAPPPSPVAGGRSSASDCGPAAGVRCSAPRPSAASHADPAGGSPPAASSTEGNESVSGDAPKYQQIWDSFYFNAGWNLWPVTFDPQVTWQKKTEIQSRVNTNGLNAAMFDYEKNQWFWNSSYGDDV